MEKGLDFGGVLVLSSLDFFLVTAVLNCLDVPPGGALCEALRLREPVALAATAMIIGALHLERSASATRVSLRRLAQRRRVAASAELASRQSWHERDAQAARREQLGS